MSRRKICSVAGINAIRVAAIIGPTLKINPELKKLIPLILLKFSLGTNTGIKDCTAGN
jgi:hypothetical protein